MGKCTGLAGTKVQSSSEGDMRLIIGKMGKKQRLETKGRHRKGCPVSAVAASSLILLGFIYFTAS